MKRKFAGAIAGLALVGLLGGCANPSIDGASGPAAEDDIVAAVQTVEEIAAMVPAEYRERGGFTISINADVEPIKFVDDEGNIAGFNPDLLRAAARVLDLQPEFQEGTFDAMVPGLEAQRFDAIASVADFVERQTHIDFIDYLHNGTGIITSTTFEAEEITLEDLCGLSVGFARGTSQQVSLETVSADCETAGEPAISVNGYNDSAAGILSVQSGEADAFWGDYPQVAYNAQVNPDAFQVVYEEHTSILGIGIHKDNPELRDALQAALLHLVEDGTYDALLQRWGLQELALPEMAINSDISIER
ncbi:ABC transporter substrate-binding protein [Agrococcus sp. ARC_14]|uniref:ABC transporter substrate-binding protein n=1 Tax=Agrococcus sp. ARC_14 TaxID=2919927 RepID=UPI001F063E1D|nr:ABC transporter substrate-binding protein [Agrococcus sp. ARC_14]MCH1881932.1 ABC transporter substrate-binding protein [Agrococcus sp. ARC_14]